MNIAPSERQAAEATARTEKIERLFFAAKARYERGEYTFEQFAPYMKAFAAQF